MTQTFSKNADFGKLLDAHLSRLQTSFNVGDKVKGVVTAIDRNTVFLDINAPSEGLMDRLEVTGEGGALTVQVGEAIEAVCVSNEEGEVRLSRKLNAAAQDSSIQDAYQARIPVEGRVSGEIKGGYEIMVGTTRGFCPYSQIDNQKQEPAAYIGQKFLFQIQRYTENGREFVLNRRAVLQAEQETRKAELRETLQLGDRLDGVVRRIMPFGVFVDVGGMDGLVPMSELAWKRGVRAEDVLQVGQAVTVVVHDMDWEKGKLTLSLKAALGDPWDAGVDRYVVGTRHQGTVTQLMPFGAFVELEPGIEGLIPISRLGGGRRIKDPGEVVKVGETVEVMVDSLDRERRRMSLAFVLRDSGAEALAAPSVVTSAAAPATAPTPTAAIAVGQEVTGIVEGIREFGAFVKLPNGKSGLLHISQMGLSEGPTRLRAMHGQFAVGKEVTVIVKEINGDRVSLTIPSIAAKERDEAEADLQEYRQKTTAATSGFGNLGDLLGLDKVKLAEPPAGDAPAPANP
jgi:small subunit ribosomal protein S1